MQFVVTLPTGIDNIIINKLYFQHNIIIIGQNQLINHHFFFATNQRSLAFGRSHDHKIIEYGNRYVITNKLRTRILR